MIKSKLIICYMLIIKFYLIIQMYLWNYERCKNWKVHNNEYSNNMKFLKYLSKSVRICRSQKRERKKMKNGISWKVSGNWNREIKGLRLKNKKNIFPYKQSIIAFHIFSFQEYDIQNDILTCWCACCQVFGFDWILFFICMQSQNFKLV